MSITTYILIFLAALIVLFGLFIVKQQTAAIIERFGRFLVIRKPGLHIKIPLIDKVAGRLSLKILLYTKCVYLQNLLTICSINWFKCLSV